LIVLLHRCAIACTLKQTFAHCKIFLEGTLVVIVINSTDKDAITSEQERHGLT